jgi:release factor glutamine methyltransferase
VADAQLSLGSLLEDAGQVLAAANVGEPRQEALRLWADLAESTPGAAALARRIPVSAAQVDAFLAAVDRRAGGEPLAYVTGRAGFRRLELHVDERVLIPRPETEGLVELVLARAPGGVVADVCTGSGAIALALADEGTCAGVVATDVSAGALAVASVNSARLSLPVALMRCDLVSALASASVDVLVSNPPYIASAEYAALDASVREWEPRLALESGIDGLEATRRLLDEGRRVVRSNGWIAIELDASRAAQSAVLAQEHGWNDVSIHQDLFGRERYLLARRSKSP